MKWNEMRIPVHNVCFDHLKNIIKIVKENGNEEKSSKTLTSKSNLYNLSKCVSN